MAIHVKKTPDIEVSASELRQLRDEYAQAFMFYAGTPPDFEEWAIARIQRERAVRPSSPSTRASRGTEGE